MTLDEAIKHAEEVAKEQDKLCKRCDDASGYSRSHNEDIRTTEAKRCEKCAKDHRQLAEWLKDYKRLLDQEPKTGHWIDDKCSVCGKGIEDLIVSPEWYRDEELNFCPFCGLKLVDLQEREDKEW